MSTTVSIILDKRESKKGFPVKLRITNNRHSDYISLKIYLSKDEFDKIKENNRLNPQQKIIHSRFLKEEHKANKIIYQMESYSFAKFKEEFTGKKSNTKKIHKEDIKALFDTKIEELKKENKYQSAGTYSSCLMHLEETKKANIDASKIDLKYLNSFHKYLSSKGKSNTTIIIYMKNLRAVWNKWNLNNNLPSPFKNYSFPKTESNKRSIDNEVMKKLLAYRFDNDEDNRMLNLFKFSYYAGGMNIKDIALLKWTDIEGEYITFRRSKTGVYVKLFLLSQAKAVISNNDSEYVFDLLRNDSPQYVYERVKSIVKGVNRRLKRACNSLEIPVIKSYTARHGYATHLMNNGASLALISKSLGHQSVSTTNQYLGSFTNDQLKEGMSMLLK